MNDEIKEVMKPIIMKEIPDMVGLWAQELEKGDKRFERISISEKHMMALYTYLQKKVQLNKFKLCLTGADRKIHVSADTSNDIWSSLGLTSLVIYIKDDNKAIIGDSDNEWIKLLGKYSSHGYKLLIFYELYDYATCLYFDTDLKPNNISITDQVIHTESNGTSSEAEKFYDLISRLLGCQESYEVMDKPNDLEADIDGD